MLRTALHRAGFDRSLREISSCLRTLKRNGRKLATIQEYRDRRSPSPGSLNFTLAEDLILCYEMQAQANGHTTPNTNAAPTASILKLEPKRSKSEYPLRDVASTPEPILRHLPNEPGLRAMLYKAMVFKLEDGELSDVCSRIIEGYSLRTVVYDFIQTGDIDMEFAVDYNQLDKYMSDLDSIAHTNVRDEYAVIRYKDDTVIVIVNADAVQEEPCSDLLFFAPCSFDDVQTSVPMFAKKRRFTTPHTVKA